MSSSSRSMRKAFTMSPNNTPRSDIFANLGFKPVDRNALEAMAQYADARPLLEAVRDSFSVSSVLQEKEVRDYESRSKGKSGLPTALLFQASAATENAPSSCNLKKQYDEVLQSARKRLELLKGQRTVLRELLDEKEAHQNHSVHHVPQQQRLQAKEVFSRFRSKVGIIRRLANRDIGSVTVDPELMNYHDAEQKFVERVADYASDVAQSYLEMTNVSMNTLLRDIRSRTATCIKRKLDDVSEDSFKDLSGEVHAYLLSENLERQDAYIRMMQACIRAYMLQRLRIHCFQVLVDIICRKRDMLFDSVSRTSACCPSLDNLIGTEANPRSVEPNTLRSEADAMIIMNPGVLHNGSFTQSLFVDEFESSFFSSLHEDASYIVQNLKERIGARKHWLDLESSPKFNRATGDFEDMLTSSSSVLEALVRHYKALLEGTNSTLGSPNKSWIKHINAKYPVA